MTPSALVPVSVLDLSPVPSGTAPSQALHETIALAQAADRLGYARYWLAEHHAIPSVASSAPTIMIAAVAGATRRIRVGSGGVMLPNHSPLVVAEAFRVLEGLHPGRIDLGLGRAPGTDQVTAFALRRSREALAGRRPGRSAPGSRSPATSAAPTPPRPSTATAARSRPAGAPAPRPGRG